MFYDKQGCETGPSVYSPHFIGFTRVLCACYACLDFVHLFINAVFISCLTVFYLLYINFAQDIFASTWAMDSDFLAGHSTIHCITP